MNWTTKTILTSSTDLFPWEKEGLSIIYSRLHTMGGKKNPAVLQTDESPTVWNFRKYISKQSIYQRRNHKDIWKLWIIGQWYYTTKSVCELQLKISVFRDKCLSTHKHTKEKTGWKSIFLDPKVKLRLDNIRENFWNGGLTCFMDPLPRNTTVAVKNQFVGRW